MCSEDHPCGSHLDDRLECDFGDLTLQSCCERDLEEQRKIEGYKRTLLQRDPTATRSRIAQNAVVRDVERLAELSDEDDGVLEALRQKRLDELHASMVQKQLKEHSGYGCVVEVEEDDVMGVLDEEVGTETLCCLVNPMFSRRDDLKEYIAAIASRNREYRFIMCCLQEARSHLPERLGAKQHTDTVLLLICNHVVVGSITVLDDDAWGEDEIEQSILTSIRHHECVPLKNVDASEDGDTNSQDEYVAPCDICGRRYYHEHK